MNEKTLTLSIIIPVYNEQDHLAACLDSIAGQTVMPDEVIIVDNNSTDDSVKVAKGYEFVTVVTEKKQGMIPARNCGFDKAKCDILARIDADVKLIPTYVATIKHDFAISDIAGLTGPAKTRVALGLKGLYLTFWSRVYFWCVHSIFGGVTMWGSNMAIRRDVWQKIRSKVVLDDKLVHEDQDLSMNLRSVGGKIRQDNDLLVQTEGASYSYLPKFIEYVRRTFATRKYHKQKGTVARDNPTNLPAWRIWLGIVSGVFITIIFIIYVVIVWPMMWLFVRQGKIR